MIQNQDETNVFYEENKSTELKLKNLIEELGVSSPLSTNEFITIDDLQQTSEEFNIEELLAIEEDQ
jgi:uncharacterized phage-like protein YoqJ